MFTTRYQDLDTLIIRDKSHKTAAGREKWIAKQIDAGAIKVMATSDPAPQTTVRTPASYPRPRAIKTPVARIQDRVTSTVEFITQHPSTRILDDTMDHAWLVGCERRDCTHQVLVAKYDYRPANFAHPDGDAIKTVYSAPGRRFCSAHPLHS